MICSRINEGTAPRYAPEGSQPASKPVAPFSFHITSIPPGAAPRVFSAASQQACLVALPVALLLHRALVVLLLALGEPDLHFGAAVLPVQLQRHDRVAAPRHRAGRHRLPAAARARRAWP